MRRVFVSNGQERDVSSGSENAHFAQNGPGKLEASTLHHDILIQDSLLHDPHSTRPWEGKHVPQVAPLRVGPIRETGFFQSIQIFNPGIWGRGVSFMHVLLELDAI